MKDCISLEDFVRMEPVDRTVQNRIADYLEEHDLFLTYNREVSRGAYIELKVMRHYVGNPAVELLTLNCDTRNGITSVRRTTIGVRTKCEFTQAPSGFAYRVTRSLVELLEQTKGAWNSDSFDAIREASDRVKLKHVLLRSNDNTYHLPNFKGYLS